MVLLSAPALRLSDTVTSAALRLRASVAAVLAAALLPSASVVLAASAVSARSALCRVDLDRIPEKILDTVGPASERLTCDFERAFAEGRIDIRDPIADRVGKLGGARVDQRGGVADAPVERGDDFPAALGERLGNVDHARGQRVGERLRAPVERFLEAGKALIERGGHFVRL